MIRRIPGEVLLTHVADHPIVVTLLIAETSETEALEAQAEVEMVTIQEMTVAVVVVVAVAAEEGGYLEDQTQELQEDRQLEEGIRPKEDFQAKEDSQHRRTHEVPHVPMSTLSTRTTSDGSSTNIWTSLLARGVTTTGIPSDNVSDPNRVNPRTFGGSFKNLA
jgi:hypothetical protein